MNKQLNELQKLVEKYLLLITKYITIYRKIPEKKCVSFGDNQIIETVHGPPERNNNYNYNWKWCTVKATLTEFYKDHDPQTVNREVIKQLTENARFALVKAKLVEAGWRVTENTLPSIMKPNNESSVRQKNSRKV